MSTFSGMTVNFTGMAVNFVAEYAHLCKNCGNIVSTENLFAPRFEERKDAEKSDSICTLCARRAKMEGIGEQIGNAIGGFFDGVGKGANRR